ncbi:MAG: DUF560 domain-containing protein [Candidatus Nitrohelix vancouverensis]|uniref:DUF560 domain-containing protein n=1 Tax=Candidatus Nitrohelix vancouverensis TaxID=2705534 RepID=A0A7T0C0I0_9BACT|nr:MAG: DUF560 domain-containing protein [Candidatus Nitrohelix vancouverensis]
MNAIKMKRWMSVMATGLLALAVAAPQAVSAAPSMDAAGGGKSWSFKISGSAIRDDNLLGAPDRGNIPTALQGKEFDDTGFKWTSNLAYNYNYTNKLSFKFDYDVSQTLYEENSDRDITTQMFGINSTYKINALVNIQLMYKYIYNIVDGDDFSGIHYIRPSFNYMHKKWGLTSIHALYSDANNWSTSLRNTETTGAGIAQYYFFDNFKRRVDLGVKWAQDEAKSSVFDRDVYTVKAGLKTPLYYGVNLTAGAQYARKEYQARKLEAGGNRDREDDEQKYTATLDKTLVTKWGYLQNLVLEGKYQHTYNRSNEFASFYRNNHFELGLKAAF